MVRNIMRESLDKCAPRDIRVNNNFICLTLGTFIHIVDARYSRRSVALSQYCEYCYRKLAKSVNTNNISGPR